LTYEERTPTVTIEPESDATSEQGWLEHVDRLYQDIRIARGVVIPVPVPAAGKPERDGVSYKGGDTAVYLVCAASAVTAVAGVIRAWLRERPRRIRITVVKNGSCTSVQLDGSTSDETIRALLSYAERQDDSPDA